MKWSKPSISVEILDLEIKNGKYDMNPPHQRDIVHDNRWQSGIIQSILLEEDIPEVYFHRVPYNGRNVLESLDGKQRISAIIRFYNNEYSYQLKDKLDIFGKFFDEVPDTIKRQLQDFEISQKIYYSQMSKEEISRFFQKRQQTKITTKGEHFNSDLGAPSRDLVCNVCDTDAMKKIQKKDNRKQRMELCVHLLHTFICWTDPNITNSLNMVCIERETMQEWYSKYQISSDDYIPLFQKTFEEIVNIILKFYNKGNRSHTTCVPIYLWYLINCIDRVTFEEYQDKKNTLISVLKHDKFSLPKISGNHDANKRRYKSIDDFIKNNMYQKID